MPSQQTSFLDGPTSALAAERILITGGSGFIGTNLTQRCLADRLTVLNADIVEPRADGHERTWRRVDVLDEPALAKLMRAFEPTVIYHLAARTDLRGSSLAAYEVNSRGVKHVITASRELPTSPRMIFASSRLVCEIGFQPRHDTDWKPSTPYGASKVLGEQLVRERCTRGHWTIVRPTSIWGPWFGVPYRDFFDAVLTGRYIHPRGQLIRKSFGYVENTVVQLLSLAAARRDQVDGRVFYLADYEPIEVETMARFIAEAANARPVRTVPPGVLRIAARTGDLLERAGKRSVPLTTFRLNNLLTEMLYDVSPVEALTGPLPVAWREGVRRTLAWIDAMPRRST